jgi:uncharacterized cofD-like protein
MSAPNIVLLGGGTGSFTLLQGLKKLTPNLTAIVNMSDDGGSTGVLRDELGVLPPGDVRQCLVALSDTPEVRDLFAYRFSDGRFDGQSLGNIILSGLELQCGSFGSAVQVASKILRITGSVVPVTLDKHTLVVRDGQAVHRGQHTVDGALPLTSMATVHLEPQAMLNPEAAQAIRQADMVVIAPGSVHTSLVPVLAVTGMAEALAKSAAKVVCVINLVNKPHQTDDWHVVDYVQQFERYTGKGRIDAVLYNTAPIAPDLLNLYANEGEYPVHMEHERFMEIAARAHGARLVSKEIIAQDPSDKAIRRTLIRHDANQVCVELQKILITNS